MKIKLVVGEIRELEKYPIEAKSKNGFHCLIAGFWARLDHESGELELDDEDLRSIQRYKRSGYKKRLQKIFGRTLWGGP